MTCRQDDRGRSATCRIAMNGDAATAADVISNADRKSIMANHSPHEGNAPLMLDETPKRDIRSTW